MTTGRTRLVCGFERWLLSVLLLCLVMSCSPSESSEPNEGAGLSASELDSAELEALRARRGLEAHTHTWTSSQNAR